MITQPVSVTDIHQIDLDRHSVIEASAGTGKTYCIENLVVRLLCEKEIPLEKILLVTFTEKAAGDLHTRIRENILGAIEKGEGRTEFLRDALDSFDSAAIFTIHGFCQRMLKQYAFENGGSFNLQMVDDKKLYRILLRQQQRRDWVSQYGDKLESLAKMAGYPGSIVDGESSWEKRVLELAGRYRPESGDAMVPAPVLDLSIERLEDELAGGLSLLAKLIGPLSDYLPESDFVEFFNSLPMHAKTKESCVNKVVLPLLSFLHDNSTGKPDLIDFFNLAEGCSSYGKFSTFGFGCLTQAVYWNRVDEEKAGTGRLREIVDILSGLIESCHVRELSQQLMVSTVVGLKGQAREYKEEHGLISFDDMLLLLADAVNPQINARADLLLKQLRKRFRYALVDEFQDTDQVQWDIFSQIFLKAEDEDHRLFVIGDPKQAIYSFRGADIHTYLGAKEEMMDRHNAALYNLPTNWRSSASMINGLNGLCGSRTWFTEDGKIPFIPVLAPPEGQERSVVCADSTRRAAMTVVHLNKAKRTPSNARLWLARFIGEEIECLLSERTMLIGKPGNERKLNAGDICILVRKSNEAEPIEHALTKLGIPYTYYKKGGLFESEEALQLQYVLKAIQNPADTSAVKASLLGKCFQQSPQHLEMLDELPAESRLYQLLLMWSEFVERRDWATLFQSILEETQLLYGENDKPGGERRIANYRRICQDLLMAAESRNLDLDGLLDILRDYREHAELLPENADMHSQESERPKVQIMTIHTSKGLEFPVVFLAGGFTRNRESDYWLYHNEDGKRVYDLAKTPEIKEQWLAEEHEENLRLYYVAVTRAVHKLYLPLFRPESRVDLAGPLSHFLFSSIGDAFDNSDTSDVRHVDVRGVDMYASEELPIWSLKEGEPGAQDSSPQMITSGSVISDLNPSVRHRTAGKRVIGSFTAFAGHGESAHEPTLLERSHSYAQEEERDKDEIMMAGDNLPTKDLDNRFILPPGAATGTMLHEVFEKIAFSDISAVDSPEALLVSGTNTAEVIGQELDSSIIAPGHDVSAWKQEVARIVYETLRKPLLEGFRLADLQDDDVLAEMEFFFPVKRSNIGVSDCSLNDGFLLGFIDLIFRHNGKFYILDWKSNFLRDGYGQKSIESAMDEAGYHLQYKVYTVALMNWLRRLYPDVDPVDQFGGVFYLFLRGISVDEPGDDGVFFHLPTGGHEIREYEEELADLFGTARGRSG